MQPVLNYVDKGAGMARAIRAAGYVIAIMDGVAMCDNPIAVQEIIDNFDPLPAAQADKWEEIKAERDKRQLLPITVNGKQFHSDQSSRIQQLGLVFMGQNIPPNLQWKTIDDTFVTMTPTLALEIFATTASHDQAVFAAAEQHRLSMLASNDPINYDFSSGWPA